MSTNRYFVSSALLVLASLGCARAEEKVLAPGDPPLTQGMVDDYYRYLEWRCPEALTGLGGPPRLAQMMANDWTNEDKARQKAILADLKWWREEFPKRKRPAGRSEAPGADTRLSAREQEALHLLLLQQRHNARQQQIRALSNLQASHHELMKVIIDNMRPSGRYEYNPATGRYDRWVPYRR